MERRPKILLVDDEAAILHSTKAILEGFGYHVVPLQDASRVLDAMRRERPDLLLQDVRMPGLDVAELSRRIRAEPDLAHVPLLLFSAGMELDELQESTGAMGVIEKPFHPRELDRTLRTALS